MTETGLHVLYLYTYEIWLQTTNMVIPNGSKLRILSHFIAIIFCRRMCTNLELRIEHTTCDDVNIGLGQAHS